MAEATAPATAEHSTKVASEYVVLIQFEPLVTPDGGKPRWLEAGTYTARSSEAAIRAYVDKVGVGKAGARLVAVPARSFRPVQVTTRTETTVVIGT